MPAHFPCETPRRTDQDGRQARFADTGAHPNLHSNLPPSIMCFSQEPIPEVVSASSLARYGPDAPFRHREVMRQWVEDVFARENHGGLVEYGTTVELAEFRDDEWVLTLRKPSSDPRKDRWWRESFDKLVVATGHYYLPYIPTIPGLAEYTERYPGRIKHSKHYRTAEEFRNKVRSVCDFS